jgi:hypothetical protein
VTPNGTLNEIMFGIFPSQAPVMESMDMNIAKINPCLGLLKERKERKETKYTAPPNKTEAITPRNELRKDAAKTTPIVAIPHRELSRKSPKFSRIYASLLSKVNLCRRYNKIVVLSILANYQFYNVIKCDNEHQKN